MVHWGWIVIALFAGVVFGMFVIALAEVSREEEQKQKRKWWNDGI